MLAHLPAELLQAFCIPAEAAINHVLRYDPVALRQLGRSQGRLLAIVIDGAIPVRVRVLDNGISLSAGNNYEETSAEASADATLSGSLSDFLALARADDKANTLINSAIDMDGDSEFAIGLTRVAQQLDIDWEAVIEPATGSLLAHQLGKGLRGLLKWGKSTAATYRVAVKDYLEDEAQLVTPKPLIAQFADDVDDLKLATDRLAARIERLQQSAPTSKE
ncbi:ubiquinone biosynthesis accessory factor UbiJ [Thalassolituus marinus]|uniref:Ubiquinone biosynthesis accessory factor UbiJ n=1 Tax=Thalassolituus marinus TaxID=671053 RepID=A0ABS7ZPS1_9GAMM|nr:SCP2 sterol-binding domain-containing protein [Thalassolituus marinus]MCA6063687.1 SCP2 sterol-binding domain-containing protein [Thalassolituus marinus]